MIEILMNMPENVVAVTASGKVTAEDYDDVLIPAIQAKLAKQRKIRMLYQLGPDFRSFTPGAIWDDAKIGLWHITDFERVAVVTDLEWVSASMKIFRFFITCPVKIFPNDKIEAAKEWITS